jgi:nucleotide-binding universal stress UspA family protein
MALPQPRTPRRTTDHGDGSVVVGVDGGPSGRAALDVAADDVADTGADVVAVHVRRRMTTGECFAMTAGMLCAYAGEWRDDVELQAWLDCVQHLETKGVRWRFQAVTGDPVRALRVAADSLGAGAVYAGIRDRGPLAAHLHRCPARDLVHSSPDLIRLARYT